MDFYISDTHFRHTNILKYEPIRPGSEEVDPAQGILKMENLILDNWRRAVSKRDTVYFLGDLVLSNRENQEQVATKLRSMPGRKVFVRGNHDKKLPDEYFVRDCGFDEIHDPYYWQEDRQWLLSHFPLTTVDDRVFGQIKEINRAFTWYEAHLNIHGHTHSKLSSHPLCFNVSVENIDFCPISAEEIEKRRRDANS